MGRVMHKVMYFIAFGLSGIMIDGDHFEQILQYGLKFTEANLIGRTLHITIFLFMSYVVVLNSREFIEHMNDKLFPPLEKK